MSLHRDLCELGAKWLKNHKHYKFRCQYVLIELVSGCNEYPDVYGYKGDHRTIKIEVKTSRNDFKADFKKRHRIHSKGIGMNRYYLCPENLINSDELPFGWGLLYCNEKNKINIIKESECFEDRDFVNEMSLMYSVIRRLAGKPQILDFRIKSLDNL